jgi:hypothetical protein
VKGKGSNIPTSIDFVILILPYGSAYRHIVNTEIFTTIAARGDVVQRVREFYAKRSCHNEILFVRLCKKSIIPDSAVDCKV